MTAILRVSNLTKDFKEVRAVDDLSFTVNSGEVYGFLGQNGAGKSTTIRMLLTLVRPTSGQIEMFGMDLFKERRSILSKIGAIIEKPDLYRYLTALENLRMFAAMSGVKVPEKKLMEQLSMVGLAERAHSKVKTYSQGMKQRLGIATALIHDPLLIVLDEPTNGLDPQGIADVRKLILHLSRDLKKTIVVSSHLLSEMELIADSMLIIDKGKKLVEGRVTDLFNPAETILQLQTTNEIKDLIKINNSPLKDYLLNQGNDGIYFRLHKDRVPEIIRELVQMDISLLSFHATHSLEDYFISLTTGRNVDSFKN